MVVAIDGPAGSGKTTVAKILAKRLGFFYLDTGAMYRALTLKALRLNCNLDDELALKNLAEKLNLEFKGEKVYLDNEDVTDSIRTPLIDKNISKIVSYPEVRKVMVDLQRKLIKGKDYVIEGRDTTTVVCPDAEFKFYLDASLETRAKRRAADFSKKNINIDFEQLKQDLLKRDEADMTRKVGALKKAADAIYIDTTNLTIEDVVNTMLQNINSKLNYGNSSRPN